jgi:FlaA1/EpsC-like NDP-sugar epimerase
VLRRSLYERFEREHREPEGDRRPKRSLLVGAGRAGVLAIREITSRGSIDTDPIGFVDDDPLKKGTIIHGARVLGTTREIPRLLSELKIDQVLITMAVATPQTIRTIVETCERAGVEVKIIPGLHELVRGTVSIGRFRKIQIEDILGREPVKLDTDVVRSFLTGKSVLVTGAGGSIGSELARQIARFTPLRLTLVDRAEPALFEIDQELRQIWPQLDLNACIADVGDEPRMRSLLARYRPQVVFHAAAHKHVPMMEKNATEAIKNNVFATARLGNVAAEHGVEAFVLISTDKAVQPTSLMGASKRAAELLIQDLDNRHPETRFLAVRFGNVLGSTGSVVPIFRKQIEQGGPVTVTHPETTRYFMTIPEAAQLVMEAGAIGSGGAILILDMGQPIRILDLAKEMIRLSGFRPFDEIPIVFTGMRPGEKLSEELELSHEKIDRTSHPKIFVGKLNSCPPEELRGHLSALGEAVESGQDDLIRKVLSELVHEAKLEKLDPALVDDFGDRPRDIIN